MRMLYQFTNASQFFLIENSCVDVSIGVHFYLPNATQACLIEYGVIIQQSQSVLALISVS